MLLIWPFPVQRGYAIGISYPLYRTDFSAVNVKPLFLSNRLFWEVFRSNFDQCIKLLDLKKFFHQVFTEVAKGDLLLSVLSRNLFKLFFFNLESET